MSNIKKINYNINQSSDVKKISLSAMIEQKKLNSNHCNEINKVDECDVDLIPAKDKISSMAVSGSYSEQKINGITFKKIGNQIISAKDETGLDITKHISGCSIIKHEGNKIYLSHNKVIECDENGIKSVTENGKKLKIRSFDTSGLKSIENTGMVKGVDISQFQGDINWDELQKSVDYVVIRVCDTATGQLDENFEQYIDECKKRNIPVGVYYFSRATSKEEADKEIDYVMNIVNKYDLEYPIYIDAETSYIRNIGITNPEAFKEIYGGVLERIASEGYCPGIYSYKDVLNNVDDLECCFWTVSHETYRDATDVSTFDPTKVSDNIKPSGRFQSFQYCETGTVPGINGYVDVDYSNAGLAEYIKENSN